MEYPEINEHQMVRISLGLCDGKSVNDFNPPLTANEKWWYNSMKKDREKFAKEHPEIKNPIWEIPFDYD